MATGRRQFARAAARFKTQWTQALGFGTVLDVSYVGNFSRHLLWQRNINAIPIGAHCAAANQDPTNLGKPLPDTFLTPYRGWSALSYEEFAGTANYNSLQVSLNRRFSQPDVRNLVHLLESAGRGQQ